MTSPKNPELSFLIEALHLSPDEVFEFVYELHPRWKLEDVIHHIADKTKANVGISDLRHFNPEVVDAWRYYVVGNERMPGPKKYEKSVFQFIRERSKDWLTTQDGEPHFRLERMDEWQDVTFHCGEDLFVTAMLADKYLTEHYEPHDFQWSYILKSDFTRLNNLIEQNKFVENHYHLGGSSPMADISWIYLMNNPFGQEKRYKKFLEKTESLYLAPHSLNETIQSHLSTLMKMAAYIRLRLFEQCVLQKCDKAGSAFNDIHDILHTRGILQEDEMKASIEALLYESGFSAYGATVDYAIRSIRVTPDECNSYIAGERYFNYCCLRQIFSKLKDDYFRVLYYLYLLVKHHFNQYLIQSNNKTGFTNFKEYTDRKSKFIADTPYDCMATNMAIQGDIRESNLEQLEARITPKETSKKMSESVNGSDKYAYWRSTRITHYERITPREPNNERLRYSDGTDKFFYVLHFIKSKDANWYTKKEHDYALMCREHAKREDYRIMAETLMEMRERNDVSCRRIFGIDAASHEVNFRPENFGPVFRYLSSSRISQDVPWKRKMPDLRKTYHAGEDFYEVIDGLRAIDEAVLYLELSQGDRIGHGVALGIDVDKWYQRHPVIALPLQNKIDNVAWMLHKVNEWGLQISPAYYGKLQNEFERMYWKLYQQSCPGLVAYMKAWKLRGDAPEYYFSPIPETYVPTTRWERYCIRSKDLFDDATKDKEVYNIYHKYHFDTDLKRRASEIERHEFNQDEYAQERVRLVKEIQLHMRTHIANKGIAVESCPSSNFLISNLDEFKEIPTFSLFPIREGDDKPIRMDVCINTDDQGVFYTNLVKEYTMLAGTLRRFKKADNTRMYSDEEILAWVKCLIDNSKQLCFRNGNVRNYGIRNDNNLFEDDYERPLNDKYFLPSD